MKRISIIGDGGFGWAWALLLAWVGHRVTVWSRKAYECCYPYQWMQQYSLPPNIQVKQLIMTPEVSHGELLFIATPTIAIQEVLERFGRFSSWELPGIITLTKGLYSGAPPCDLVGSILPEAKTAHITGASFSEGLVKAARDNIEMDMVVACDDPQLAVELGDLLKPTIIRPIWTCGKSAVRSVQLGFAMRPLVSFMQGLAAGYVSNHQQLEPILHLIQSKMMFEGYRIALELGADEEKILGDKRVASILMADYDLCRSLDSRNFAAGDQSGKSGLLPSEHTDRGVVEAVNTIRLIYGDLCLAKSASHPEAELLVARDFPYYHQTFSFLCESKPLDECVEAILARDAQSYPGA